MNGTSRTSSSADERAVSTPLSHVLSIAITTLLIIGLVSSASGFLESQEDRTAEEELNTVGNRLAVELDRVDSLASQGDAVTITTDQIDRVAGRTYDAVLEHGTCPSVRTDTCLKLSMTEFDHTPTIPIDNRTDLSLDQRGEGRFTISSDGGTDPNTAQLVSIERDTRIGVGRGVGRGPSLGGGSVSELPQPKDFDFDPDNPHINTDIEFDASASYDPDGSIETYRWDFDNDNTWDLETDSPTGIYNYGSPGLKNVTLQVEDDAGLTASISKEFNVVGFIYQEDSLQLDPSDPNDESIEFTVTNQYTETIRIERLIIDPTDDSFDQLSAASSDEISINSPTDSRGISKPGMEIKEGGTIVILPYWIPYNYGTVEVQPGDSVDVTIRGFNKQVNTGDEFRIALRYRVDGNRRGMRFTDTVG